jgi:hypothetical protein
LKHDVNWIQHCWCIEDVSGAVGSLKAVEVRHAVWHSGAWCVALCVAIMLCAAKRNTSASIAFAQPEEIGFFFLWNCACKLNM